MREEIPTYDYDTATIVDRIRNTIRNTRFTYTNEADLQAGIHQAFLAAGLPVTREYDLGDGCRIDFLIEDIGIEVKVAGSAPAVARQLARYSYHLNHLVLLTTCATHLNVTPPEGPTTDGPRSFATVLIQGAAF